MHGLLPYIPPPARRSCGATVEYLSLLYLSISPLDDGLGGCTYIVWTAFAYN
jgi:hypothetical protein